MRRTTLFTLKTPYREPMEIVGFEFGDPDGEEACAIVGSMRGNEVQQTYTCARLVQQLRLDEAKVMSGKRILVVPSVNPFSMNVSSRFWALDHTDINRTFPGYDKGETTQRIAEGLFSAVSSFSLGIQLCSLYMPGEFVPHVRLTRAGEITKESLALADGFGLPYVVINEPTPFDTTMLNYNWQVWSTNAFSLYGHTTEHVDEAGAVLMVAAIERFLATRGVLRLPVSDAVSPHTIEEAGLVAVRTEKAGGFLMRHAEAGDHVEAGQVLAEVVDALDAHVKETLRAPVSGQVFFCRTEPLVEQHIICFRIAADE